MLPTPEDERAAIMALLGLGALVIVGAVALIAAIGLALVKTAQWVFG